MSDMKDILEVWSRSRELTERVEQAGVMERFAEGFKKLREGASLLERESLSAKVISKEEEILSFILGDYLTIESEKSFLAGKSKGGSTKAPKVVEVTANITNMIEVTVKDIKSGSQRNHEAEDVFWEFAEAPYRLITALKDVQQFIGVDGKKHGPMKPGDLITVPSRDAEILIGEGLAESVE
jgi:hypothetical protein